MYNIKDILLRVAGLILLFLSGIYIVYLFRDFDISSLQKVFSLSYFSQIFILVLLYSILLFILATAWRMLFYVMGDEKLPFNRIISLYLRSNIARYLPGNIFHFVSRQILGSSYGMNQLKLGAASIIETGMLISIGIIIVSIGFFLDFSRQGLLKSFVIVPKLAMLCLFLFGSVTLIVIFRKKLLDVFAIIRPFLDFFIILKLLLSYTAFIIGSGIIPFIIIFLLSDNQFGLSYLPLIIWANTFAWLSGFLAPGVPAGIGVREAALGILLTNILPNSMVIMTALCLRIVILLGDLIMCGIAELNSIFRSREF